MDYAHISCMYSDLITRMYLHVFKGRTKPLPPILSHLSFHGSAAEGSSLLPVGMLSVVTHVCASVFYCGACVFGCISNVLAGSPRHRATKMDYGRGRGCLEFVVGGNELALLMGS